MALKVTWTVVSNCATNCYMVYDDETMKGFIVDPGDSAARIIAKIGGSGFTPEVIILTHGHYDHIGAAREVADHFNIPIWVSEADDRLLHDPQDNLSTSFGEVAVTLKADRTFKDDEMLSLAGHDAAVMSTPGHTPGSVCFYFKKEGILFSGDTLFCESLGRSDFPGGSTRDIVTSIVKKLFVLPDETRVYPGHNEETTIAHEKQYNPCARFIGQI